MQANKKDTDKCKSRSNINRRSNFKAAPVNPLNTETLQIIKDLQKAAKEGLVMLPLRASADIYKTISIVKQHNHLFTDKELCEINNYFSSLSRRIADLSIL